MKKYTLLKDRLGHPKGTTVVEYKGNTYGLVFDDNESTGVPHMAVAVPDINGEPLLPFFTVPVTDITPADVPPPEPKTAEQHAKIGAVNEAFRVLEEKDRMMKARREEVVGTIEQFHGKRVGLAVEHSVDLMCTLANMLKVAAATLPEPVYKMLWDQCRTGHERVSTAMFAMALNMTDDEMFEGKFTDAASQARRKAMADCLGFMSNFMMDVFEREKAAKALAQAIEDAAKP